MSGLEGKTKKSQRFNVEFGSEDIEGYIVRN